MHMGDIFWKLKATLWTKKKMSPVGKKANEAMKKVFKEKDFLNLLVFGLSFGLTDGSCNVCAIEFSP